MPYTLADTILSKELMAVNRRIRWLILVGLLVAVHVPLLSAVAEAPADVLQRDSLFQVSTLSALLAGLYDGVIDFGSLSTYGDFGIGTFDRLNGEMIGFDGSFYQIDSHGTAHRVSGAQKTPFACVTFFEPDFSASLPHGADYAGLSVFLTSFLPTGNLFYAIRLDGTFSYVKTRSVPAQEKPYRPLVDIVAEQPTFEFHHVEGTLIGFRCPDFVAGINVPGDHLHFLTSDRISGGHVLDVVIDEATLTVDITPAFLMLLPLGDDAFYTLDLSADVEDETEKVEK